MTIITVDLGRFRAYKIVKNEFESAKITLLKDVEIILAHKKYSDRVSDGPGKFGLIGGKKSARKGYGEAHKTVTEERKRLVKQIAKDIEALITGSEKWYLAAETSINRQILNNLSPGVASLLEKNITADLIKASKSELLSRFGIS
ncbi:MAG: host attachment protein [Nitrospirae bacterium]|nr:host attachment protein [Nitrospirota bacterium]